jgi:hypothetical protein
LPFSQSAPEFKKQRQIHACIPIMYSPTHCSS